MSSPRPSKMFYSFVFLFLVIATCAQETSSTTSTPSTDSTTTSSTTEPSSTSITSTTPASSTSSTDTSTSTSTSSTDTSTSSFPSLTSSTTSSTTDSSTTTITAAGLTNAPTVAGYTVPSLIVPDTSAAAFMQKSNLPEGTVFICVGAALGFFGACVLAWRALIAWSLQRSVQRAASAQFTSGSKARYRPVPFGGTFHDSNVSMENLTSTNTGSYGAGQTVNRKEKKQGVSKTPTTSSLFFSPTAGAGVGAGMNVSSNRASGYLPSGYYPSGSAAPAAGAAIAHIGGPSTVGYGRIDSAGNSPPATSRTKPSPGRRVSTGRELDQYDGRDQRRNKRGSKFGLQLPGERAPSAVLDSWFDHSTAMSRADRE